MDAEGRIKMRANEFLNLVESTDVIERTANQKKWSEKYKNSINCNNPKGFSQRAHCQGRKKNKDASQ